MEKVTFCIASYDDTLTLIDTIKSILETTVGHDIKIIVVDDANTIKHELDAFTEVAVYRNLIRKGVGFSLHKAVEMAETEIVCIQGNDLRYKGDWLPLMYETAVNNPKSIISGVTLGLNHEQGRLQITGKENKMWAAKILFEVTTQNNPRVLPFRRFLEAKWATKPEKEIDTVGCALGACYFVNRSFFLSISPWLFHKTWGNLEPLISMCYYINGGNCLIDTRVEFGHVFRTASSSKPIQDLIYNKLLNAYLYLPTDMEQKVFDWVKTLQHSQNSFKFLEENKPELDKFRQFKLELGDEEIKKRLSTTGLFDS